MSSILTDQRLLAGDVAPIAAPTAATVTYFQYSTQAAQRLGAGNAQLEIPGQYKATNRILTVNAIGNSKMATVGSQALTVTISAVNAAGTKVVIATTGAVACATQAAAVSGWFLTASFVLDPVATIVAGTQGPHVSPSGAGVAFVATAALSGQPGFTLVTPSGTSATQGFAENQYFVVAITQAIADTTAVHTLTEFTSNVE